MPLVMLYVFMSLQHRRVVDHIILTDNTYATYGHRVSFIENGYMELIFLSDMHKNYIEIEPKIIRDKEEYGEKEKEMGKKIGFVEGEIVGIDKGLIQGKLDMAKKMLSDNENVAKIIKYTGLTAEDIVKIKNELSATYKIL